MEFKKYNSIENSYREKYINIISIVIDKEEEWVVSEKIHGQNFSIWLSDNILRCAKRSSFISEDENFGNFKSFIDDLREKMFVAKKEYAPDTDIVFFGENCGGSYNHPDVEKDRQAKRIQKGVDYHPSNKFICFDIKIDGEYINDDLRVKICKEFEIPFTPILFRGKLSDCLKYPNEFDSLIGCDIFNLPKINNNICEGVVIKPTNPKFLNDGSRVILKNKNDKWTEKSKAKKEPKQLKELSPNVSKAIENASQYVTENKLRNVLSKIGDVTNRDFGKIIKDFNVDILEDYSKDFPDEFNNLLKAEQKQVSSAINKQAANLIRANFLNIIDGGF